MKKISTWCFLSLVVLASAAWSQAQQTAGTEQAVAALEQKWLQSQKTNNADLLVSLLADNFVSTSNEGKVSGKAETLATAKSMKWSTADYNDLKVSVYGDTAIVTGGFKGKRADASGKRIATAYDIDRIRRGAIEDPAVVREAMQGVDAVVNFAAESHNSLAILDPGRFMRTNALGTQVHGRRDRCRRSGEGAGGGDAGRPHRARRPPHAAARGGQ